jgi:hypothetical protein
MDKQKENALQLLKACIAINVKYKDIWFKTDSKSWRDKLVAITCLLCGLYQTIHANNVRGTHYILSKYPDFETYISLSDSSDKELMRANYVQILAYLGANAPQL